VVFFTSALVLGCVCLLGVVSSSRVYFLFFSPAMLRGIDTKKLLSLPAGRQGKCRPQKSLHAQGLRTAAPAILRDKLFWGIARLLIGARNFHHHFRVCNFCRDFIFVGSFYVFGLIISWLCFLEGGIFARFLRTVAQVLRRGLTPGPLSEKERGDISSACWQVGFCNSAVGQVHVVRCSGWGCV